MLYDYPRISRVKDKKPMGKDEYVMIKGINTSEKRPVMTTKLGNGDNEGGEKILVMI